MKDNLENKTEIGNAEIPFKDLGLITCPIKKSYCEVRGNYYKCYFKHHDTCGIYKNLLKRRENGS